MACPQSADEFLQLLERSQLLEPARLREAAAMLEGMGMPATAAAVAERLREAGLITRFHETQLLAGKARGFRLGKYRILELLGAGGMGRVFLAEHAIMRRQVALKVLPKEKSLQGSALGRFQREARAVAALDHPNIVRAYDIDNDGDLHFLVMEYVAGSSLQQYVQQYGAVPWPHAADFIRQAADALQHAADAGMVHRDVKPGNLLLDAAGSIKVLDLGLAVLYEETDADPLTVQHQENVLGTADYLAPEQALDSHNVDARADVYGLGGTLHFLLAGQPPFPKGTVAQKLLAHQHREPQRIEELAPDTPPAMAEVLRRMLRKRPADRFAAPRDVAAALAPFAQPLPHPYAAAPGADADLLGKPGSTRIGSRGSPTMAGGVTPGPVSLRPLPVAAPDDRPPEFDFLQPKQTSEPSGKNVRPAQPAAPPPKPPRLSSEGKWWIGLGLGATLTLAVVLWLLSPKPAAPAPASTVRPPAAGKPLATVAGPDRSKDVEVDAKLGWRGARSVGEGLALARPGQTVWLRKKAVPWDADGLELGVGALADVSDATLAGVEPFTPLANGSADRPALAFRGGKRLTLRDLAFEGGTTPALEISAPNAERFLAERVAFRNCAGAALAKALPAGAEAVFRDCVFRARPDGDGAVLAPGKDEALAGTVAFERCIFVGGQRGVAIGGPVRKLAFKECRFLDCAKAGIAWTAPAAAPALRDVEISGCTFCRCGAALLVAPAFPPDAAVKVSDTLVAEPRSAPLLRNPAAPRRGVLVARSALTPGAPTADSDGLAGDALGLRPLAAKFRSYDPARADFLRPEPDPGHAKISPERGYVGAVAP